MSSSFRSRSAALLVAGAVGLALVPMAPAAAAPADPTISIASGSYVYGTRNVVAMPDRGDKVTSFTVDGVEMPSQPTLGHSTFAFTIGSNSMEARYNTYLLVNGNRLDLTERDYVNERAEVAVPNEWLKEGDNSFFWQVGTFPTGCGTNYDDYVMSQPELITGGPVTAGRDNRPAYSMGDGSCGSNPSLLTSAEMTFTLGDNPADTVGLSAELDTVSLEDGPHTLKTTTAGGVSASSIINVNNGQRGSANLAPEDDTRLKGTQPVAAIPPGEGKSVQSLTLDGEPLAATPTLGTGNSTFRFRIGSNSADPKFGNYLSVNGHRVSIPMVVNATHDLEIPNSYLKVGTNQLELVSGSIIESCGLNYDDFDIDQIQLIPSRGKVTTEVEPATKYLVGDGSCNPKSTRLRTLPMEFTVADTTGTGLLAELDTTQYSDGPHTVRATMADGAVSQRSYIFDNTAPAITSSIAEGQRLTEPTVVKVEATDPSGVKGEPTITLDGVSLDNGTTIGAGMSAGEHKLVIEVEDALGNKTAQTITFTTADIPEPIVEAQAEAAGDKDVKLSATVTNPGGGEFTATFHEARGSLPGSVINATATSLPTTLDIKGTSVAAEGLHPGDGATIASTAGEQLTMQRFDLPVADLERGGMKAEWQGIVDPTRSVTLHLWDGSRWEPVATARGQQQGNTALSASIADRHIDGDTVHALVVGEDPFADDINKPVDEAFADPDSYDFSIAHYTDTQYLSEGSVRAGRTEEEKAKWQAAYRDLITWIADNRDSRKIAYAAHTGDITETNIRKPEDDARQAQIEREFEFASAMQKILDDTGLPNGVLAGNHDNWTGQNHELYNQHFGPQRYAEVSKSWPEHASYGGGWREGDNQNHYDLFTAGGLDFIAVHLSFDVQPEEVEWANEVLRRYPDRNAILFSHAYRNTSSQPDGRDGPYSNAGGLYQFESIVKPNRNVFLVLSGHHHGVSVSVLKDVNREVSPGHNVVELLADYQFYAPTAQELGMVGMGDPGKPNQADTTLRFGSSFLRLLQFDVKRSEMIVDTYSPYLNNFNATEYDLEKRYDGREDDFTVPVQLSTRKTTIQTDSMALVSPTGKTLGTSTVKSGEEASITIPRGQASAWYVVAVTPTGGTATSRLMTLPDDLTTAPTPPTVTVTPTVTADPVVVTPTVTGAPITVTPTVTGEPVVVTPTVTGAPITVTPTTTADPVVVTPTVTGAPITVTPTVTGEPVIVTPTVTGAPVTVTPTVTAPKPTSPAPKPTTPAPTPSVPVLKAPYEVPGFHTINGRQWNTTCEPYGNTIRCWTYIWSKQAVKENGQYRLKEGWHFNNLTYLPYLTKAQWGTHHLANTGEYTINGRKWRTECNTKVTGKNACRSYTWATVIVPQRDNQGRYTFRQNNQWVFNNMVRFKVS